MERCAAMVVGKSWDTDQLRCRWGIDSRAEWFASVCLHTDMENLFYSPCINSNSVGIILICEFKSQPPEHKNLGWDSTTLLQCAGSAKLLEVPAIEEILILGRVLLMWNIEWSVHALSQCHSHWLFFNVIKVACMAIICPYNLVVSKLAILLQKEPLL